MFYKESDILVGQIRPTFVSNLVNIPIAENNSILSYPMVVKASMTQNLMQKKKPLPLI